MLAAPRPSYLKILVCGPFASGKTTFVKTLCGTILGTDVRTSARFEKTTKDTTTVALDFGKVFVRGVPVYLFGTPGQSRFQFMLRVLSVGMHGYIYIVDGSSLKEVLRGKILYDYMLSFGNYPHIIAVNKQDIYGSLKPDHVARILGVGRDMVYPLIAKRRDSALKVLEQEINLVLESYRAFMRETPQYRGYL